jgi:LPS O-antigen subunit length determinant protein (WzzB/FepE family)
MTHVDLPGWAWLLIVWCLLSGLFAAGMARWFRFMRDGDRDW